MLKILLILNVLIEGVIGLIFIIRPSLVPVFQNVSNETYYIIQMYGFAAIAIAFLSLQMLLKFHEQALLSTGLLFLSIFHLGIGIAQALNLTKVEVALPALILHIVFSVGFIYFYFQEK